LYQGNAEVIGQIAEVKPKIHVRVTFRGRCLCNLTSLQISYSAIHLPRHGGAAKFGRFCGKRRARQHHVNNPLRAPSVSAPARAREKPMIDVPF